MKQKTISKSKIEWCTHIDTSIVGCNNNCSYHYGRKMVMPGFLNLWEKYLNNEIKYLQDKYLKIEEEITTNHYNSLKYKLRNYKPVFLESRYVLEFPQQPAIIFMNPFSDISDYNSESFCPIEKPTWIKRIAYKINKSENKNHIYIFLTKKLDDSMIFFSNSIYYELENKHDIINNIYFGFTFTKYNTDYDLLFRKIQELSEKGFKTMWSLEYGIPVFFKGIKKLKSDAPQNIKDILVSWGKANVCNFND